MCLYSCSLKHNGDTDPIGARVRLVPQDGAGYGSLVCLHCPQPHCAEVCPTNAIARRDGAIAIDDRRCIGCLLCTLACPYGGMAYDPWAAKPMACDLCDGAPECVRNCPERALEFGNVESMALRLRESRDPVARGNSLCMGCGPELALRFVLRVLGPNIILHVPPSCASLIIAGYGHKASVEVPATLGFLTDSASFITGIKRHYQKIGKEVHVVTFAGDGGTADVGFQALSGAAERNEDVIYICNDNEGYMNTGIQRSGTTPYAAWTTTTPVGAIGTGKRQPKKAMPWIMLEHGIPYVATATIGFLSDLEAKLRKAMQIKGFRYIHILNPCNTGWHFPTEKTIEVARKAVQTNFFPLWEAENGRIRITVKMRTPRPVEEYTGLMGKYSHLSQEQLRELQRMVDENYRRLEALASLRYE